MYLCRPFWVGFSDRGFSELVRLASFQWQLMISYMKELGTEFVSISLPDIPFRAIDIVTFHVFPRKKGANLL